MNVEDVYAALVESYWADPWPPQMALAAAAATRAQDADIVVLTRIIHSNIVKPDFNAMAAEVTRELENGDG